MPHRPNSCFVAFAFFVIFVVPADAAVLDPELRVVIRTYDSSAKADDLSAAIHGAAAILEDAGVAITWVECDAVFVSRDQNPCRSPLAANELSIRFVRLPPHVVKQDLVALGDSLVDTRLRIGSLATIYVNRVTALAKRCGIDWRTLLGRAIAHEIGHLLLGTSAHAASGLMRATWSQHTIRRGQSDDWRFTAREGEALRNAVLVRTAQRLASAKIG